MQQHYGPSGTPGQTPAVSSQLGSPGHIQPGLSHPQALPASAAHSLDQSPSASTARPRSHRRGLFPKPTGLLWLQWSRRRMGLPSLRCLGRLICLGSLGLGRQHRPGFCAPAPGSGTDGNTFHPGPYEFLQVRPGRPSSPLQANLPHVVLCVPWPCGWRAAGQGTWQDGAGWPPSQPRALRKPGWSLLPVWAPRLLVYPFLQAGAAAPRSRRISWLWAPP